MRANEMIRNSKNCVIDIVNFSRKVLLVGGVEVLVCDRRLQLLLTRPLKLIVLNLRNPNLMPVQMNFTWQGA